MVQYQNYLNYNGFLLVRTPGNIEICAPYQKFVLTVSLSNIKALKGTETLYVLICSYESYNDSKRMRINIKFN